MSEKLTKEQAVEELIGEDGKLCECCSSEDMRCSDCRSEIKAVIDRIDTKPSKLKLTKPTTQEQADHYIKHIAEENKGERDTGPELREKVEGELQDAPAANHEEDDYNAGYQAGLEKVLELLQPKEN